MSSIFVWAIFILQVRLHWIQIYQPLVILINLVQQCQTQKSKRILLKVVILIIHSQNQNKLLLLMITLLMLSNHSLLLYISHLTLHYCRSVFLFTFKFISLFLDKDKSRDTANSWALPWTPLGVIFSCITLPFFGQKGSCVTAAVTGSRYYSSLTSARQPGGRQAKESP